MGSIVPSRRSLGWVQPIDDLRRALKGTLSLPPLRAWPVLWSVLHGTTPPTHVTWHSLIGGISVSKLRARLNDLPALTGAHLVSWNIRWLLDPHTAKAAIKRTAILGHLLQGKIVCLQETHWHEAAAAQWQGLFPAAIVVPCPSRPGPGGGHQGGVAILLPHPIELISSRILVPGCAI